MKGHQFICKVWGYFDNWLFALQSYQMGAGAARGSEVIYAIVIQHNHMTISLFGIHIRELPLSRANTLIRALVR